MHQFFIEEGCGAEFVLVAMQGGDEGGMEGKGGCIHSLIVPWHKKGDVAFGLHIGVHK